jgi:release factor glutamine methyltransferase
MSSLKIQKILKKYSSVETELLLSHVLGKSREFLYMESARQLSVGQLVSLQKLIKRRENGEPVAYILGYKDFYGLRFKVNKSVLIPRPETEWVVERKVESEKLKVKSKALRVLDVGTGSGCIAISIAKQLSADSCQLTASDVSAAALKVAKQNAKLHKVKIKFVKSDLLKNIKGDFDIIIANLPYGWHGVKNRFSSVKDGLKFEPQRALYTKEKGLFEIRRLLEQITQKKQQPKLVYLEFDPRQKADLQSLIKKYLPKGKVKFYKDFNNFWRYAEIKI